MVPPFLQRCIGPVIELPGDGFDAGGLFDGLHVKLPGEVVAEARIGQLHGGMIGVGVDALRECFKTSRAFSKSAVVGVLITQWEWLRETSR